MPKKSESRFAVDLLIRVFGMDAGGHPFHHNANVRNISDRGATIGLDRQLNPGDVIGVQLGDRKARCQVVWTVDAELPQQIEVGLRLVPGQPSPWQEQMYAQQATAARPMARDEPTAPNKRRFLRQRVLFPIDILDGQNVTHMNAADVAGGGCYVETTQPLPAKKTLSIGFWLNSRRVHTTAIVRTSDGGVGMGIEFTGLDEVIRGQLQEQIEHLVGSATHFKRAR